MSGLGPGTLLSSPCYTKSSLRFAKQKTKPQRRGEQNDESREWEPLALAGLCHASPTPTPPNSMTVFDTLDVCLHTFAMKLTFAQPCSLCHWAQPTCLMSSGAAGGRAFVRAHLWLILTTLSTKVSPPGDNIELLHLFSQDLVQCLTCSRTLINVNQVREGRNEHTENSMHTHTGWTHVIVIKCNYIQIKRIKQIISFFYIFNFLIF